MFERREDRGRLSAPCLCTPQCAVLLLVRRTYYVQYYCSMCVCACAGVSGPATLSLYFIDCAVISTCRL